MTRTAKGLVATIAAVVGLVAMISVASAAVSSLGIESKTVVPNASVTVNIDANATTPGVGAYTVDVVYDSKVSFVSCTSNAAGLCNNIGASSKVRFTGASAAGVSGAINIGAITFTAGAATGISALDVQLVTLTDPEGADITGVTAGDGTITIAVATPTPTPSPTAVPTATGVPTVTAVPTATVRALPATGGAASDGSSSVPWALGVLGLAVLAGGVWVTARTRRESL